MLPQYRLHTDFSKEAYAENLAKIASELGILEPILCCLNIAVTYSTDKISTREVVKYQKSIGADVI